MAVFLTAAASWVLAGADGAAEPVPARGDRRAALTVMALALAVGWHALRRAAAR